MFAIASADLPLMDFVGRTPELGRLRGALDQREASLVRVTGLRGVGKTAFVARTLADYAHLSHRAPPFPDLAQRESLMGGITRARARAGAGRHTDATAPSWPDLLRGTLDLADPDGRPFVVVLDDVQRLAEARCRHRDALVGLLAAARSQARPLHVVLVGPSPAMPTDPDLANLPDVTVESIELTPLPFRAACALLPGGRPNDLVLAYGVFGGIPRVLAHVDRQAALGTNVRRLLLGPEAPLSDAGGTWLERDVQTPARYYSILAALSGGETDWSTVHAGVPDLTRSGQVAPYVRRLEELGLVASRRSLDAAPRSRARRYTLTDPFFATYMRFCLPPSAAPDDEVGMDPEVGTDAYTTRVRPALDAHAASVFPAICRQHMRHGGKELFGSDVRENGSLWGPGYDIPVAGTLTSGFAYYGTCRWAPSELDDTPLDRLDRELRDTRYGFGREHRMRLVFTGRTAPRWLQRDIARRHDARLIDPTVLVGDL